MRSIEDLNFKLDAEFFEEEFKLIEERSWFSDAKLLTALAGKGIKKGIMGAGDAIVGRLRNMIKNLSKPNGIYEQTFSDPEVQNSVYNDYLKDGDTDALNKLYNLRELKIGMDQTKILRESTLAKLANPSFMQLYKLMDNYAADSMKKKRKEAEELEDKATMITVELTDDENKRIDENNKKVFKYDNKKHVISEADVVEYDNLKKIVVSKIEEKSKELGIVDEQGVLDQEQADELIEYIILDLKSRYEVQGKVPSKEERFAILDQLVNEQNKMTDVENARKLKNKNMLDITEQELNDFINVNDSINKIIKDNYDTLLINSEKEDEDLSNSYLPGPAIIDLQFLLDEPEIQTEIDKARIILEMDPSIRTEEDVTLYNKIKEEQVIKAIKDNPDKINIKDKKDIMTLADIYLKPLSSTPTNTGVGEIEQGMSELENRINEGTEGDDVDLQPITDAIIESPKIKNEEQLSIDEIDQLLIDSDVTLPSDVKPEAVKTEIRQLIFDAIGPEEPDEILSDDKNKEVLAEIIDELPDNMRSAIASETKFSDEQESAIKAEFEDIAKEVVPNITDDDFKSLESDFFALPPSLFDLPSEDDILSSITVPEELKTQVGETIKSGEDMPQDVYNQIKPLVEPTLDDKEFTDETAEVFAAILPEGSNEKAVATLIDAYLGAGYMGKDVDSKKMGENIKKMANEQEMPRAFYDAFLQWLRNGFDDGWYGIHDTQEDLNIDNKDIKPGIISELSKNGIEVSEDEVDSLIEKFKKKDVEVQKEFQIMLKRTNELLAQAFNESIEFTDEYLKLLEENINSLKDEEERG